MTDIRPGDLVLRDGKAEEVEYLCMTPGFYIPRQQSVAELLSNATRIGATADGWRVHTGTERPADVRIGDTVEVVSAKGTHATLNAPMEDWNWRYKDTDVRIIAYRVVSRAERLAPKIEIVSADRPEEGPYEPSDPRLDAIAGAAGDALHGAERLTVHQAYEVARAVLPLVQLAERPDPTPAFTAAMFGRPIQPSELRAGDRVRVTVERTLTEFANYGWYTAEARGWVGLEAIRDATIHLLHREPEPLNVGDRVKTCGRVAEVRAISEDWALIKITDPDVTAYFSAEPISDLERIP